MEMGRAPSSLDELRKLIDSVDDGENSLEFQWLGYTYNMLLSRKMYHKKQQVKKNLMLRAARTLLAPDEIASIDRQAEDQAGEVEVDETNDEGGDNADEQSQAHGA
jgi:hypothetical protein